MATDGEKMDERAEARERGTGGQMEERAEARERGTGGQMEERAEARERGTGGKRRKALRCCTPFARSSCIFSLFITSCPVHVPRTEAL